MPSKNPKAKKTCVLCKKRTRSWTEDPGTGEPVCQECEKNSKPEAPEKAPGCPQDRTEEAPATSDMGEGENAREEASAAPAAEGSEGTGVILADGEKVIEAYIAQDIYESGFTKWREQPHVTYLRNVSDSFNITLTERERDECGRSAAFLVKEIERKEEGLKEYAANVRGEIKTLKGQLKDRADEARTGVKSEHLTASCFFDHHTKRFITVDPHTGRVLVDREPFPGEQIPLPLNKPEKKEEPQPEKQEEPQPEKKEEPKPGSTSIPYSDPQRVCDSCTEKAADFRVIDELDTDEYYCRGCMDDVDLDGLGDSVVVTCLRCRTNFTRDDTPTGNPLTAAMAHICPPHESDSYTGAGEA